MWRALSARSWPNIISAKFLHDSHCFRAPLATQEPWSSSEPHPCPRGGMRGWNPRAVISEAPGESQPLAEIQSAVRQSSWPEPPASSLMRLFFPPPSHPSSSSATHVHMLPLTPPTWWPFLTDQKECGSRWRKKDTALRKSSVECGFFRCGGQVV